MLKLTGYFNEILRDDHDPRAGKKKLSPEDEKRLREVRETQEEEEDKRAEEEGSAPSPRRPVTISVLLTEAFKRYEHISREDNEKMRLRHRLQVSTEIEMEAVTVLE